jgi:signal peptidase I
MQSQDAITPEIVPTSVGETDADTSQKPSEGRDLLVFIGQVVLLVVLVRSLFVATFNIPSESMLPRLLIGDYLIVNKFAYGYSKHSFPFSPPVFKGRILSSLPERGDVAVFKAPPSAKVDYIKRVIGLPGDRIQMIDGVLHINDKPVLREKLPDIRIPVTVNMMEASAGNPCDGPQYEERGSNGALYCRYTRYKESLPSGRSYVILDTSPISQADNTQVFTVPQEQIFFMGDNRDRSADSRFPAIEGSGVGMVPMENLVGKAWFTVFSVTGDGVRWSRIGDGF